MSGWRAVLPSLLSRPSASLSLTSSLSFAAFPSLPTSSYAHPTFAVPTSPPTRTSFSGLLPPTQISSCLFAIHHSPKPTLPNKPQCPQNLPPHVPSPYPNILHWVIYCSHLCLSPLAFSPRPRPQPPPLILVGGVGGSLGPPHGGHNRRDNC